jgi:hypothetical protein
VFSQQFRYARHFHTAMCDLWASPNGASFASQLGSAM